jgi:alpha-amylase/alpha-mannosidase (GH57 family)
MIYITIGGHLHQPDRHNAVTGRMPEESSAFPFHDWTARITSECYQPNTMVQVWQGDRAVGLVNNYAYISVDIGFQLMRYFLEHSPITLRGIVAGDKMSQKQCDGHGGAFALAGNHMILPLANEHDKYTQVRWGKRAFQMVFGRETEGIWLPESAVDSATLEVLIDEGIKFTVLAPRQARRWRRAGTDQWYEGGVEPGRPYFWRSKRHPEKSIALFFYDGPISQAVAFEHLARGGDKLVARLFSGIDGNCACDVHRSIHTDFESYGHHEKEGQRALGWAINELRFKDGVKLSNYGHFLATHAPEWEVEIWENSSWSCEHGVERWRSDCGCNNDPARGWHQRWRAPLRAAMDFIRDAVDPLFVEKGGELFNDPWAARDAYIEVFMDERSRLRFIESHFKGTPTAVQIRQGFDLLEMQRHRMLMYTSCGWFFNDVSELEPVKMMESAFHAMQLANRFGLHLQEAYVGLLANAESNVSRFGNGASVYYECVREPLLKDEVVSLLHGLSSVQGANHLISLLDDVGAKVVAANLETWQDLLLRTFAQLLEDGGVPQELRPAFESVANRLRLAPNLLGWNDAGVDTIEESGFRPVELRTVFKRPGRRPRKTGPLPSSVQNT